MALIVRTAWAEAHETVHIYGCTHDGTRAEVVGINLYANLLVSGIRKLESAWFPNRHDVSTPSVPTTPWQLYKLVPSISLTLCAIYIGSVATRLEDKLILLITMCSGGK